MAATSHELERELVRAYAQAPAATIFKRLDSRNVTVPPHSSALARRLYEADERQKWTKFFLSINDKVAELAGLPWLEGFGDHNAAERRAVLAGLSRSSLSRIDNWASTLPVTDVFDTFDRLSRGISGETTHSEEFRTLIAFATLLIDLGLAPKVSSSSYQRAHVTSLADWLAYHCPTAVAVWNWAYSVIYQHICTASHPSPDLDLWKTREAGLLAHRRVPVFTDFCETLHPALRQSFVPRAAAHPTQPAQLVFAPPPSQALPRQAMPSQASPPRRRHKLSTFASTLFKPGGSA